MPRSSNRQAEGKTRASKDTTHEVSSRSERQRIIVEEDMRRLHAERDIAAKLTPKPKVVATRHPVPAPSCLSTWDDELWKLQRLYYQDGALSIDEGDSNERILRIVHHCTDPDWEAINWAPEGLTFEVRIPGSYPEPPLELPSLSVQGPDDLPDKFVETVPLLFTKCMSQAVPRTPVVYRALQTVDKHLTMLWLRIREAAEAEELALEAKRAAAELAESRRIEEEQKTFEAREEFKPKPRKPKPESEPWTGEEQSLLEAALVEFSGESDVKKRWNLIAQHVGGGRSARDCADRFRACRDFALGKIESPDVTRIQEAEPVGAEVAPKLAPSVVTGWSAEEVKRLGSEVRLVGLDLEGFDTLILSVLRIQVVCTRCRKPMDLATDEGCSGTDPRTAQSTCHVCKQELGIRLAPSICHGGCPSIAHVLGVNCHPIQMLRSDFEASCGNCTETARVRNIGPGYRKRAECNSCFSKINLSVEGAEVLGQGVAQWRQVAEEEGDRLTARRQLQDARKRERELGIKVGQPLPEKGTCKHYGKSYRWLRFPCCGRAFPCDTCHDEQTDHPHEWANRMLCGLCSHEQPFSKDKCTYCGAAQTRSRSAFWEGGDGCRNRATMSKSDPHKYKGLSKTATVKKK